MEDKMLNNEQNTQRETLIALLQRKSLLQKDIIECDEAIMKLLGGEDFENLCQSELLVNEAAKQKEENTAGDIHINMNPEELRKVVAKHLKKLGIPVNLLGYKYLKEGISMVVENPLFAEKITKDFYPGLATKFKTSTSRIERAIRHAIEIGYSRVDTNVLEEYFEGTISGEKPTNSEFLATLVEKIQFELQ